MGVVVVDVEIEYCVPCGLLDKAIEVERMLLSDFGAKLTSVRLRTGSGGVFKVRAGTEEIFDGRRDGWDPDRIRSHVADRLVDSEARQRPAPARTLPVV